MSELPGVLDVAGDNTAGFFALSAESQAVLFFLLAQGENLKLWLDFPDEQLSSADIDDIDRLIGQATYEVMNPVIEKFPESFYIDSLAMDLGVGNSLNRVVNGGFLTCHTVGFTTAALGNYLIARAYLRKGTYAVNGLAQTNASYGIMKVESGAGSTVANMDWYSGAPVANVIKSGTFTIDDSGEVEIFCYMGSKNAASSNYQLALQAIWGHRTGD